MAIFAERLKLLRTQRGLTQQEVAEGIGVSRATIGGYEAPSKQREPDFQLVRRLADFFGVSTDYLLGRKEIIVVDSKLADIRLSEELFSLDS